MSRLIDVMIVGAQKAGTTSLLRYLGEHPQCCSHPQKEFAYFVDSNEYDNDYTKAFSKYFSNKVIPPDSKIIAKSAALYAEESAIKRLYEHNPNCKLIIILRNPVERAYSSYLMEKNYASVKFEFSELPELIKKHEDNDESWGFSFFINYGLYANHLKTIYKYFPKEQVKVVLYSELENDARKVCQDIFKLISVDPSFLPNIEVRHNVTQKTRSTLYAKTVMRILRRGSTVRNLLKNIIPDNKAYKYGDMLRQINKKKEKYGGMKPDVKQFLIAFYKPYNEELEKMIDLDLSKWNQ